MDDDMATVDVERVVADAASAAGPWGAMAPQDRAGALRAVAGALDAAGDDLVAVAAPETHLSSARLSGELLRTTFQLHLFADLLEDGAYLRARLDQPDADWPPGARPALRRMLFPLGPVVVFAAGNFPFAFSVAGGDTASALAAGCPVILKAHPGHPRLSKETASVVRQALRSTGAPEGVFAMVSSEEAGRAVLESPAIRAGAFTGSLAAGRLLFDAACARPDPIPFYAEMGSVNPAFVTRGAFAERGGEILAGFVASFTLGAGQFCTKPGLLFLPEGAADDEQLGDALGAEPATAPLLNEHVLRGYRRGLARLRHHPAVRLVAGGAGGGDGQAGAPVPSLLATTTRALAEDPGTLLAECFGPASLVVSYEDDDDLLAAARSLDGQLTASVHADEADPVLPRLLPVLAERAGRIIWNGWPTGVSVTWAMQHGGPYPATTSPLHTSVGTAAIERFLRPVAFQSFPDRLLPGPLRDANPLGIPRQVDGRQEGQVDGRQEGQVDGRQEAAE